jgi:hypothetical protein
MMSLLVAIYNHAGAAPFLAMRHLFAGTFYAQRIHAASNVSCSKCAKKNLLKSTQEHEKLIDRWTPAGS